MPAKKTNSQATSKVAMPRRRKLTRRNRKKLTKGNTQVAGSFRLLAKAFRHLWRYKRTFGAILLIYTLLYFVFVKGFAANFQLTETRDLIKDAIGDELGTIGTASTLFGVLVGSTGSVDTEAAGVYQLLLLFVVSLTIIWALRYTYERKVNAGLKQSLYQGMTPAVPYLLICLTVLFQTLPALIAMALYTIVQEQGLAVSIFENIAWVIFVVGGISVSIYWASSSVLASYIVTLPGMTPMRALRSARELVRFRRFLIVRKVAFLPVMLLVLAAVVLFPLVLYVPIAAEILFLVYTLAVIIIGHTYLYELYRELL